MAVESLLLCTFVFVVSFSSTESSSFLCKLANSVGDKCRTCDFLTFGQEDIGLGISYFCPMSSVEESYCCYDLLRRPFCCNAKKHLLNGFLWIGAAIVVIRYTAKFIKWLIN